MVGLRESLIMGVVNVTPDSFSDGGQFLDPGLAVAHMERLWAEGADIIDLGAESSRPGAPGVEASEEWRRLEPVLMYLSKKSFQGLVSVDSFKAETMRRLVDYPVHIVNDIRGGADQETLELLASRGLTYLAMHMHGSPQSMQQQPLDGQQAVDAVERFYRQTRQRLAAAGFPEERIWLDPGIGFGKTDRANLLLMQRSLELAAHYPLVLGISRKSFLGRLLDLPEPMERDAPSKMLELGFIFAGVHAIRTHDVKRLHRLRQCLREPT